MIPIGALRLAGHSLAGPRIRRSYHPQRGWESTYYYTGTQGRIASLLPKLKALGKVAFVADMTEARATLEITAPDSGDPQSDKNEEKRIHYDIQTNVSQKSLFEHWRTVLWASTPSGAEQMRAILTGLQINQPVSGLTGDAANFYDMIFLKKDDFIVSQTVAKVTVVAPTDAEAQAIFSNSNCIYTTEQMLEETAMIEPYRSVAIACANDLGNGFYQGNIPSNYLLGWLKVSPSINTIASEKSATNIEFWLEAWSLYSYNIVV